MKSIGMLTSMEITSVREGLEVVHSMCVELTNMGPKAFLVGAVEHTLLIEELKDEWGGEITLPIYFLGTEVMVDDRFCVDGIPNLSGRA